MPVVDQTLSGSFNLPAPPAVWDGSFTRSWHEKN
jgi:hypothetical protein